MDEPVRTLTELNIGEISVLEAGPETGMPVVCIHGVPAGAELWRDVLRRLGAAGYRAYAPDMPGYGQTRLKPGGDHSLSGAAECIASWMQVRDIAPAAMVAHDIGGGALQILAVRYPELVDQLVFSNAVVGDSWPVAPIRFLTWIAKLGLYPMIGATRLHHIEPYLNHQFKRTFARKALATRKDLRRRIFFDTKMTTSEGRHAFAAHLKSLDNTQTVAVESGFFELDVPVLLLWGQNDPFQPWAIPGKRLHRHFPHADVEMIESAGHFLMLDEPDLYADRLIAWLNAETEVVGF